MSKADTPARRDAAVSRRQLLAGVTMVTAATTAGAAMAQGTGFAGNEFGTVWWSELRTRNPGTARDFYSKVVGWTPKVVALEDSSRTPNEGEDQYTLFTIEGREAAGALLIDDTESASAPAMWFTYIQVSDVDAAARRAVELGGKMLNEPFDAPNVGRMAVVQDPEGARFGLINPVANGSR